jgi:hypothetical protein
MSDDAVFADLTASETATLSFFRSFAAIDVLINACFSDGLMFSDGLPVRCSVVARSAPMLPLLMCPGFSDDVDVCWC